MTSPKKQTALQELIEELKLSAQIFRGKSVLGLNAAINKAANLLTKERQQIYAAYAEGLSDGQNSVGTDEYPGIEPAGHEIYFKSTYITQDK